MPDEIEETGDTSTDNSQGNTGIALAQEREKRRKAQEELEAERREKDDLKSQLKALALSQENNNNAADQDPDLLKRVEDTMIKYLSASEAKVEAKEFSEKVDKVLDDYIVFTQASAPGLGDLTALARKAVKAKISDLPDSSSRDIQIIKQVIEDEAKVYSHLEVMLSDNEFNRARSILDAKGQPLPPASGAGAVGHVEPSKPAVTTFNDVKKVSENYARMAAQKAALDQTKG